MIGRTIKGNKNILDTLLNFGLGYQEDSSHLYFPLSMHRLYPHNGQLLSSLDTVICIAAAYTNFSMNINAYSADSAYSALMHIVLILV